MRRYAARTDANQREIVKALTRIGCTVFDTSMVGRGYPDLTVGLANRTLCLEIKDGSKSPSRRKLTEDQERFGNWWRGHYVVVSTPEEAIDAVMESTG